VAVAISQVLDEAERVLQPARLEDYCVNGLQVPGSRPVSTLASGVSASLELFAQASDERAELLIVHHGLFWGAGIAKVDDALKRRLQVLFDADIALAAYHLPLDAHPQIGNNALLARALGGDSLEPFALHRGEAIGFIASLPGDGAEVTELASQLRALTAREPLVFAFGPPRVRRLAVVSGAGADYIEEALRGGAHALITGELPERAMAEAREAGLHLIAAGHYATETFGVRKLGERLAERFGLRHVFLDVPNPL
jgi:dinuclear metal center YbgI/SA1388 family protein